MTEFMTQTEVSEWLKLTPRTIKYLVNTGQIPFVRISKRRVMFEKPELEKYIKRQRNVEVRYDK